MIARLRGRLLAVVRSTSVDQALKIADALAKGGLSGLEIAVNNEHGIQALRALSQTGDRLLGAGSVLNEQKAREACEAGAAFLVSPGFDERVLAVARKGGVLYIPGVLTPTEIKHAQDQGCELLKLFPAGVFGPGYLKDLHGPFPGLKLMPTGGVRLETIAPFLEAGAFCLGVGGALLQDDLIAAGDFAEITRQTGRFVARMREFTIN